MTAVMISGSDPRSIKAIEIAAGAADWIQVRLAGGAKAYGVPSSTGKGYWLTTCRSCNCPDAARHSDQDCKHILAVRLYCELVKAQEAQPGRRRGRLSVVSPTDRANAQRYDDIFKRFESD